MIQFDMGAHIAEKCQHCHLFIEENSLNEFYDDPGCRVAGKHDADKLRIFHSEDQCRYTYAQYVHLSRGDDADEAVEGTHDAQPSGLKATIAAWQLYGPAQMRERFVPDGFDPIRDEHRPDAVGVALLAGVPWEIAQHHSYEALGLLETVREADRAAEGDSNDSEISALSGALAEALQARWPEIATLRSAAEHASIAPAE